MVMFSSHTKYPNLWNAEANIHGRGSYMCSCFSKGDSGSICDNLWGLRPETSLSLHLAVKKSRKIYVRRSWIRSGSRNFSPHTFGLWMVETLARQPLISAQARGESKFVYSFGSKDIHNADLRGACSPGPFIRNDQPVEEPWLLESSGYSQSVRQRVASSGLASEDKSLKTHISGSFPVEEPWLFQPSHFFHDSKSEMNSEISENEVSIGIEVSKQSRVALKKDSVSRVLLINSSLHTMHRIAVLEDEKLVEILLEPVKNEVQAGNVYLGIVKELLPDMGGALVNIGSFKSSLVKRKKYGPFIFPLVSEAGKQRNVNGSDARKQRNVNGPFRELLEILQDVSDDPVQNLHDDFGEREMDNEDEVSDDLSHDVNGNVGHLDRPMGSSHNSHPQTMSSLTLTMESSSDATYLSKKKDLRSSWAQVKEGTKIIVQVIKEESDTEGPRLTPYPVLESRFWILSTSSKSISTSKKTSQSERARLRAIARSLQPPGFGLFARSAAAGHTIDELKKDLDGLLSTWEGITKQATSAALAADEGVYDAVPVMLHRAMGQTFSVVQDYCNNKVKKMVVDSQWAYHEVTNYLQEMHPDSYPRVELYSKRNPLFDEYNIEEELKNILNKRVPLSNGGDLVIEQTEALASIDVNGGQFMLRNGTSMAKAILNVNLAAAKEIARQIRLRDIGGLIVVDFIDMSKNESHRRNVYREVKNAVLRDRSVVEVSELSKNGLMEITRQKVRPGVTDMISEDCTCCHATGRIEALETLFSKIEREICRLLAMMDQRPDAEKPNSWPTFILRVDRDMCDYLTSGKNMRLAMLRSSLKVRIRLKVDRAFSRGAFKLEPLRDRKDDNLEILEILGPLTGAMPSLRPLKTGNTSSQNVNIFPKTGDTSKRKVNIVPKKWKAHG